MTHESAITFRETVSIKKGPRICKAIKKEENKPFVKKCEAQQYYRKRERERERKKSDKGESRTRIFLRESWEKTADFYKLWEDSIL